MDWLEIGVDVEPVADVVVGGTVVKVLDHRGLLSPRC